MAVETIKELINLWPNRALLAGDLNAVAPLGRRVSVDQVHKWAANQSIPPRYQARFLSAARLRGLDVTAEQLVALHDPLMSGTAHEVQPEEDAA
jgi:hypothetical protein